MPHKNKSTAIFLLDDTVKAIAVVYEDLDLNKDTTAQMKYQPAYLSGGGIPKNAVVMKTLDAELKVGDHVVAPTNTRLGMTVVKVVAVDVEVDLDDEDTECHWIVGKVDLFQFENCRQIEEQALIALKENEVGKKKHEARAALEESLGDKFKQIPTFSNPPKEEVSDTASE